MKMTKVLSVFLSAALAAAAFTGCQSAPAPSAPAAAPSTPASTTAEKPKLSGELSYWSSWNATEPQAQTMVKAAEEFMKEYPDVKIEFTFNGRDNSNLVVPALQSGQKIDMYDGNVDRCFPVWKDNAIVLDEYFTQSYPTTGGKPFNDCILPAFTNMAKGIADGKLMYVPYIPQAFLYFYNKDIFKEAGVTAAPKTWDEFMQACEKIKAAGYIPLTFDDAYAEQNFGYYLSRLKGDKFVADLVNDTTKAMWDDPAVLEAAKVFEDMVKKGYFAKNVGTNRFPAGQQEMVIEGKIAMYLNGTWLPNEVKDVAGEDFPWGQFAYPTVAGGVDDTSAGAYGSFGIAIDKKCQAPDAAFQFAVYLTTGKWDAEMSKNAMAIPMSPEAEWPANLADSKAVFEGIKTRYPAQTSIVLNKDRLPVIRSSAIKLFSGNITAEQFIKEMKA